MAITPEEANKLSFMEHLLVTEAEAKIDQGLREGKRSFLIDSSMTHRAQEALRARYRMWHVEVAYDPLVFRFRGWTQEDRG